MAASERHVRNGYWGLVNTDKGWVRLKVKSNPVLTVQESHKVLTDAKLYHVEIHSGLSNLY